MNTALRWGKDVERGSPSLAEAPEEALDSGQETELQIQRGDIALCFLFQRKNRSMRVIDFRAGPQAQKADIVQEVAEREGVERVFTIVEREEATTWVRAGFEKEGTIPGFYKRSDGYLLGMQVEQRALAESGTRIRIRSSASPAVTPLDRGERAYQAAKKAARGSAEDVRSRVKLALARPQDVLRAQEVAERSGRSLTQFESFGRTVEWNAYLATARGGFSVLIGTEVQLCFDNVWLDFLVAPRGEKEVWLTVAAVQMLMEQLKKQGLVSAFVTSPVESVELMTVLIAAGFRRTGRLGQHLRVGESRADAFLWARKLADPT